MPVFEVRMPSGEAMLIDQEDWSVVSGLSWYCVGPEQKRYVRSQIFYGGKSHGILILHRLIALAKPGEIVDHINGNTLDNRKCNLRICTPGQNARNRRSHKGSVSKFKGVWRDKGSWRAQIRLDGKKYYLGRFQDEVRAAMAYDEAAKRLHGEYARTNF